MKKEFERLFIPVGYITRPEVVLKDFSRQEFVRTAVMLFHYLHFCYCYVSKSTPPQPVTERCSFVEFSSIFRKLSISLLLSTSSAELLSVAETLNNS